MKKSTTAKFKFFKIIGKILLPVFIIIFPLLLIAFAISPKVFSIILRIFFNAQFHVPPKEFLYTESVRSVADVSYGERLGETMDLHLPANKDGKSPLIIWVHGGAYVAGDKGYLTFFARVLANYGYAVAVLNYTLAPEAHYPEQIFQIGKAYNFLTQGKYQDKNCIDTERIFLAGDSAGAQMVSQFALLQTNLVYRGEFVATHPDSSLPEIIPTENLRGMLLYCGPYSLKEVQASPKPLLRFLFWQMGWAYFGKRRLTNLPALDEVDIVPHLTATFPPSFVSDGNTLTFTKHGKDLVTTLKGLGVPTTELIFENSKKVPHEFQLNLGTPEARQALVTALAFLKKYS
jgi:Esterase/lipase